jgi:putative ABC transport system permease protein
MTLSLGIAVNLAIFALVNAVLIRPLPYQHPAELIAISTATKAGAGLVSWQDIDNLRASTKGLAYVAGYRRRTWGLSDSTGSPLEVVLSGMVTTEFLRTLDVVPQVGADFQPENASEGNQQVALLSNSLWQKRYHGNPGVVGSSIELNSVAYRVTGILPADFSFAIDGDVPDLYIPLSHKDYCCDPSARGLEAIGRVASGVSISAIHAELDSVAHHVLPKEMTFTSTSLASYLVGDNRRALLLLWLAASLLSTIAALNAGAILVARALRQFRQYAIKTSLGVSFRRLIAEQLAYACMLAGLGSVLGLATAVAVLRILMQTSVLHSLLRGSQLSGIIDWRVFIFSIGFALVSAAVACLLPLTILRRLPVEQVLRDGAMLSPSRKGRRLRATLIVTQIALSVALFASAATLARSLHTLFSLNPGFREENVLMAGIGIPEARYDTDAKMIGFHDQVVRNLLQIPGIQAAAFGAGLPVHPLRSRFQFDSQNLPVAQRAFVPVAIASPEIFNVLDMPLLAGRPFNASDRVGHPYVAIVNQEFARRYLPGQNAVGIGMQLGFYNGNQMKPWSHFQIIGIIADSRNRSLAKGTEPQIYLSTLQVPLEGGNYFLLTSRGAETLATEVANSVWQVDSHIERVRPKPLRSIVEAEYQESRVSIYLFGSFAILALALVSIGLAASMNAGVVETTREIGIRSALGQSRTSIAWQVVRTSLVWTLIGLVVGLPMAVLLGRALGTLWLGLPSIHFEDFVFASGIMEIIAFFLAILPAWRATKVSPMEAIRAT